MHAKYRYLCKQIIRTLSSPRQIPQLSPVFPTEVLISIKPPETHRQAYVYSWVNIVVLLAVHFVHANFMRYQDIFLYLAKADLQKVTQFGQQFFVYQEGIRAHIINKIIHSYLVLGILIRTKSK